MQKKIYFKKALVTFGLILSVLPAVTGKLPIAAPEAIPETEVTDNDVEEGTEPGIQPYNDRDHKEFVKS